MIIHTVKNGDSLYSIGKMHGVTVNELIAANGETVEPSLIIGQAVIVPTPEQKQKSIYINGYAYPFIDENVLLSTLPYLTFITPFSTGIRTDSTLIPIESQNLITTADNNGVRALLIITTLTEAGTFSSENAARVLSDISLSDTLIQNIITELENGNYYGVDIDFEYIPPEYMNAYAQFISNLREKLNPLGYLVFVSLAPKTSSVQRGLLYEAHNYSLLGAAADFVLVMTYEWGYTYGPPMAVAPINKVREVLEYAVSEIPKEKLLMGIPNYAYDWTLPYQKGTAARSMSNNDAIKLARDVGAQIVFDMSAATPYFTYYDQNKKQHIVWFEDARSILAKADLLSELGLAGLSIWNVMSFFKPMYTVFDSKFNIIKV